MILRNQFPDMPAALAKKFIDQGYRDVNHIVDLLHGDENGMELLTSFTGMSKEEMLRVCGLNESPEFSGVTSFEMHQVGGALIPESEEGHWWTDSGGVTLELPDHASLISRFGPARDQGAVGSCTAFATGVAIESGLNDPSLDVSERWIYWGTKQIDGINSEGSFLKYSTAWTFENGICFEATWPYVEDRSALKIRPPVSVFREAKRNRPETRTMLPARSVDRIKGEIAAGRAVAISVPILRSHRASLRFQSEGLFTLPLGIRDQVVGGHAIAACAFLDNSWLAAHGFDEFPGGGCFLIRNSWAERWGRHNKLAQHFGASGGYGIVPYRFIELLCVEAYSVTVKSSSTGDGRDKLRLRDRAHRNTVSFSCNWWEQTRGRVVTQARQRLFADEHNKSGQPKG